METYLASVDPAVTTAVTGGFADVTTLILALIGGLFALTLLGIGIRLGIKFMKRGAKV